MNFLNRIVRWSPLAIFATLGCNEDVQRERDWQPIAFQSGTDQVGIISNDGRNFHQLKLLNPGEGATRFVTAPFGGEGQFVAFGNKDNIPFARLFREFEPQAEWTGVLQLSNSLSPNDQAVWATEVGSFFLFNNTQEQKLVTLSLGETVPITYRDLNGRLAVDPARVAPLTWGGEFLYFSPNDPSAVFGLSDNPQIETGGVVICDVAIGTTGVKIDPRTLAISENGVALYTSCSGFLASDVLLEIQDLNKEGAVSPPVSLTEYLSVALGGSIDDPGIFTSAVAFRPIAFGNSFLGLAWFGDKVYLLKIDYDLQSLEVSSPQDVSPIIYFTPKNVSIDGFLKKTKFLIKPSTEPGGEVKLFIVYPDPDEDGALWVDVLDSSLVPSHEPAKFHVGLGQESSPNAGSGFVTVLPGSN